MLATKTITQAAVAVALTLLLAGPSMSQSMETDPTSRARMSELGFIVGDWKGTGWSLLPPGPEAEKVAYEHTEKVRFKLDSTAILLEARYEYANGATTESLSVLTYDKEDGNYSFVGHSNNGDRYDLEAELIDGKFYISVGENVRMVLWINEEGQWYEKAEYRQAGDWVVLDEMTLDREG